MKKKLLNRIVAATFAVAMTVSSFSITSGASDVNIGAGKYVTNETTKDSGELQVGTSESFDGSKVIVPNSKNHPYYEVPMVTSKKVAKSGKYKSALSGNALYYYNQMAKRDWTKTSKVTLTPKNSVYYYSKAFPKEIALAFWAYTRDNTKYYWIGGGYSYQYWYSSSGLVAKIELKATKYNSKIMKEKTLVASELNKAVKYVKKHRKSTSTAATLKAIDLYVCNHMKYGHAEKYIWYEHTVNGGLLKKHNYTGVCESYGKITKLLCDRFKIPCMVVTSYDHLFDFVKVNGKWYLMDPTWDDIGTKPSYKWFLLGKKKGLDNDHHDANNNYQYTGSIYDQVAIPVPALSKSNY